MIGWRHSKLGRFFVLSFLILLLAVTIANSIHPVADQERSATLSPTDNAYVVADLNDPLDIEGLRTLNTGNLTFLKIWYAWNVTQPGTEKIISIAYLKFNLSSLDALNITSATLMLYASKVNLTGVSRDLSAYYVSNNSWSQNTLNFDNSPSFDNETFVQTAVSAPDSWYSFNVTQLAQKQVSSELTMAIAFSIFYEHNEEQVIFNSQLASQDRPQLIVDYTSSPTVVTGGSNTFSVFSLPGIVFIVATAILIVGFGSWYFFRRRKTGRTESIIGTVQKDPTVPHQARTPVIIQQPNQTTAASKNIEAEEKCPRCGELVEDQFNLCPNCGYQLGMKNCSSCNRNVRRSYKLCPYCGAKL